MKKGIFYIETILKLKEDINNSEVKAISDDFKEIKIKFLNEEGKPASQEEILKYIESKSINNISENSIQKEIKKYKNNKEKMQKLSQEIMKEISDPLELITKLDEYILKEVKDILQKRGYFSKNKIIRLAGITKEENEEIAFYSKSILWKEKLKKASQQGIKVFSNSEYQLPVILKKSFEKQGSNFIPSKNNFKVVLSPLSNPEHFSFLIEHLYRTLQAKKEGKINAIPTIFIYVKKETELDEETLNIVNKINEIQKEFLGENSNLENIDKLYENFNLLLKKIKENNIIKDIEIKLPLPIQEINLEQIKIKLKQPLLDVGVKVKEKEVGKEKLSEIVDEVIDKVFNEYIEINSTYRIDDTGYGFFENNLDIYNDTPKAVISSNIYDKIIDEIFNKCNQIKNENK